jgi:hypothetical protein
MLYNQPFNPYIGQQFQPIQTMQPMQPMPQMQPSKPDITVAQVATIDQVEQVQMLPGERKVILVQNAPVIAIRIADQMGLVQTEYRKTETFDPHAQQAQPQAQEYAPMAVVQQMQAQMHALAQELESMKGASSRGKSVKQSVSAAAAVAD